MAERDAGAFVNDGKLAVSSTSTLNESLLASGFPYDIRETADNNLGEYAAFSLRAQGVRRMGSAVLYLAWLAAGRFDGYWELRTGPWDVAGLQLLISCVKTGRDRNQAVRLVNPPRGCAELAERSGLREWLHSVEG